LDNYSDIAIALSEQQLQFNPTSLVESEKINPDGLQKTLQGRETLRTCQLPVLEEKHDNPESDKPADCLGTPTLEQISISRIERAIDGRLD
jgi:hypothetical protein